jgi:transcriptional regulator with GAF, ATPase, and Fis domain
MDDPSAFEHGDVTDAIVGDDEPISRREPHLRFKEGGEERNVRIEADTTLGSAQGAGVRVVHPTVSRLHARIVLTDAAAWIEDLGSTNGTYVDGVEVRAARLHDGARLRVGEVELAVRYDAPSLVPLWPEDHFGPLCGKSSAMRALFDRLSKLAPLTGTILLHGETGTGKELAARAIHEASGRENGPFIVVDCGAIPESLFESELFGHVRGAFTGAERTRDGAIAAADGGTLFLDEIAELPLSVQPKLLRALEARSVRRVGESSYRSVDVRIVAATHRDLAQMVTAGNFREDLFFRLAVFPVHLPPLRARRGDIPLLVEKFMGAGAIDAPTMRELRERAWPGNVRELRNFVERAAALGAQEALASMHELRITSAAPDAPLAIDLDLPLKEVREAWGAHAEREYLRGWLERKNWNVSAAADAIGVSRTYVHRLIKKYGLRVKDE